MMLLWAWPEDAHINRNVQQPAVGTSVMLGPPAIVTRGWYSPNGRPSTTTLAPDGESLTSHSTLLLLPSARGLPPATSLVANKYTMASPCVPKAHGTGHGPLVRVQPPCAHCGGCASVSTVPAQPPANVCTAVFGLG